MIHSGVKEVYFLFLHIHRLPFNQDLLPPIMSIDIIYIDIIDSIYIYMYIIK